MKFFLVMCLLAPLCGATMAVAQDQSSSQDERLSQVPVEHRNKQGLIEPTSAGSSGAASGTPAGASDGLDEGTIGGVGQAQNQADSFGVSGGGSGAPNPYPNAVGQTGQIVGGSVIGTGALSSAHPGQ
jgi:hypothetical protein